MLLLLYLCLCVVFDILDGIDGCILYVDDGSYDVIWVVMEVLVV